MFFACETKLAICSTFYFFNWRCSKCMLSKICRLDFLNRRHSQSAVKKCVGLNSARTRPNLAHFSQQEVVFLNHTSISHYRLTPTKNTHVSSLFHSFAWNWLIQSLSQLNLAHFSQQDVVFLSHISLSLSLSAYSHSKSPALSLFSITLAHPKLTNSFTIATFVTPTYYVHTKHLSLSLFLSLCQSYISNF
jgi:hypothetical protein